VIKSVEVFNNRAELSDEEYSRAVLNQDGEEWTCGTGEYIDLREKIFDNLKRRMVFLKK
jgi:hypothetical protein